MKNESDVVNDYLEGEIYVTSSGTYSHKSKRKEKERDEHAKPKRSLLIHVIWFVLFLFYGGLCTISILIGMNCLC